MNRIKVFGASHWGDEGSIYGTCSELERDIDQWLVSNPSYYIISQSVALTKNEALISVLYTTIKFERINTK
jgi:hypothetical protein